MKKKKNEEEGNEVNAEDDKEKDRDQNLDALFEGVYIYTAAVSDIILNLDYPDIECAKNPLQRRLRKFKVIFYINSKLKLSKLLKFI